LKLLKSRDFSGWKKEDGRNFGMSRVEIYKLWVNSITIKTKMYGLMKE